MQYQWNSIEIRNDAREKINTCNYYNSQLTQERDMKQNQLDLKQEELEKLMSDLKKVTDERDDLRKELQKIANKETKPTDVKYLGGFPRMITIPTALEKAISKDLIKSTFKKGLDSIAKDILYPTLKYIIFPKTKKSLRKQLVWRTISMRILNYFVTLILLVNYEDHDDMPQDLVHKSGIAPWWIVCRFFKHFNFKLSLPEGSSKNKPKTEIQSKIDSKDTEQSSTLQTKLQSEYICIHTLFFAAQTWLKTTENYGFLNDSKDPSDEIYVHNNSVVNEELEILDCHLPHDSKRPVVYNNVETFISWYNKRRIVGAYDELSPTPVKSPVKGSQEQMKTPSYIAHNGLHHLEIQIMETVLNAMPNSRGSK